jgi:hypothetical protein
LKHKDIRIEIHPTWKVRVKAKAKPEVIGVIGNHIKNVLKYLSNIPANQQINELQKTAILGTEQVLAKVLM